MQSAPHLRSSTFSTSPQFPKGQRPGCLLSVPSTTVCVQSDPHIHHVPLQRQLNSCIERPQHDTMPLNMSTTFAAGSKTLLNGPRAQAPSTVEFLNLATTDTLNRINCFLVTKGSNSYPSDAHRVPSPPCGNQKYLQMLPVFKAESGSAAVGTTVLYLM